MYQRRHNTSISIGREHVILRISYNSFISTGDKATKTWAYKWLEDTIRLKPNLLDRFKVKEYESGQIIHTARRDYRLVILSSGDTRSSAKLIKDDIHINLSHTLSARDRSQVCALLTAKIIGKNQHRAVEQRIRELNQAHFSMPIKKVVIKNNSSNWGSCSNKGNINIATRTLLAPQEVQDYIFIHELAHLIELNHSDRFWNLVGLAMPEYKMHEKWLNTEGLKCNF